jgi:hypothetical protein
VLAARQLMVFTGCAAANPLQACLLLRGGGTNSGGGFIHSKGADAEAPLGRGMVPEFR